MMAQFILSATEDFFRQLDLGLAVYKNFTRSWNGSGYCRTGKG